MFLYTVSSESIIELNNMSTLARSKNKTESEYMGNEKDERLK
jgi:hypothetical protein